MASNLKPKLSNFLPQSDYNWAVGDTNIKISHNLYDMLGESLINTIDNSVRQGRFVSPSDLDHLIEHKLSADLDIDFGDDYHISFGYNKPLMGQGYQSPNQKYRVGFSMPIKGF